jgi:hypothetical protein
MGLVQDVHAAIKHYRAAASETALAAGELARQLDALNERLSAHGPLGGSDDPDLTHARTRLITARQRLTAAAESAHASLDRAQQYADRAFPL